MCFYLCQTLRGGGVQLGDTATLILYLHRENLQTPNTPRPAVRFKSRTFFLWDSGANRCGAPFAGQATTVNIHCGHVVCSLQWLKCTWILDLHAAEIYWMHKLFGYPLRVIIYQCYFCFFWVAVIAALGLVFYGIDLIPRKGSCCTPLISL